MNVFEIFNQVCTKMKSVLYAIHSSQTKKPRNLGVQTQAVKSVFGFISNIIGIIKIFARS